MGEIKDAQKTDGVLRQTHIGGQALIEGIMMRGKYNWAVAVRQPDGDIYTEEHDLVSGKSKNSWMYKPIIRGCTALVESLALGYKALEISANHAYDFSEEEEAAEQAADETSVAIVVEPVSEELGVEPVEDSSDGLGEATDRPASESAKDDSDGLGKGAMTVAMVLGIVLGVVIFIVLPAVVTNLIVGDYGEKTLTWNLVDGVLRVAIFIAYIWLISLMKDIKRMFSYHGAEHKTIHCYEHGLELTPANADSFPRLHVRCGTAFLLVTMLIAIFVFSVVPINALIVAMGVTNGVLKLILVILSRIILMPLVAGLAYEVTVKWAGSRPENPFVKVVLWPGMQMQRLTTNQPDESMLECAIAAMQIVLAREELEAAKALAPEPPCVATSPCVAAAQSHAPSSQAPVL